MKPKIFIDGHEGTTGLRIHDILSTRTDLDILKIGPELRKDAAARKSLLNAADLVFLCLPDSASREAVTLIDNPNTKVIDASTAFRTDPAWTYGLPELNASQRTKIKNAKRVANPGCHATAFILSIAPLISAGILAATTTLTCFSITGYSGGGKKMIAEYEAPDANPKLKAPRHYALQLTHKHLPEMTTHTGLAQPPYFTPVVAAFHTGLAVQTFLPPSIATPLDVHRTLSAHYSHERFIRVMPLDSAAHLDAGFFDITACNNTNRADIFVFGNAQQIIVVTRLDNLGKGASRAAVQCMNLMLGMDESTGLSV